MSDIKDPVLIYDIIRLVESEENLRNWLLSKGLIHNLALSRCKRCRQEHSVKLRAYSLHDGFIWFCKNCAKGTCLRKDSFFARCKCSLSQAIQLIYYWCQRTPVNFVATQFRLTCDVIESVFNLCREVCVSYASYGYSKIGGPDVVVELGDHRVSAKNQTKKESETKKESDLLVLCGVERGDKNKLFLVSIPDRSGETLVEYIQTYVEKGSIIATDNWEGYDRLADFDYRHISAKDSSKFNRSASTNTNSLLATWSYLKRHLPQDVSGDDLPLHLAEFVVRRQVLGQSKNNFIDFAGIVASLFPFVDATLLDDDAPLGPRDTAGVEPTGESGTPAKRIKLSQSRSSDQEPSRDQHD